MAKFANKVTLSGYVATAIKTETTKSGVSRCFFNIAVDREKGRMTDYIAVIAWDKVADNIRQSGSKKGDFVEIVGEINVNESGAGTDRKKYVFVLCTGMVLLCDSEEQPPRPADQSRRLLPGGVS